MDSIDIMISKHMSEDERDRLVHNYGHKLMAKHYGYDVYIDPDSNYHKLNICENNVFLDTNQRLALTRIYLAGKAAEEIYHNYLKNCKPSEQSMDRLMKDIEYSKENIIKEMNIPSEKIVNVTQTNMITGIPITMIALYVKLNIIDFEYIAKLKSLSPKQLMQNGLLNHIAHKTNKMN